MVIHAAGCDISVFIANEGIQCEIYMTITPSDVRPGYFIPRFVNGQAARNEGTKGIYNLWNKETHDIEGYFENFATTHLLPNSRHPLLLSKWCAYSQGKYAIL